MNLSRSSQRIFGSLQYCFHLHNVKLHISPVLSTIQHHKLWKYKVKREKVSYEGDPVIRCKNAELNFYKQQTYGKFDVVPLASKGWKHRLSKGDYFIIDFSQENPAYQQDDNDDDTKLSTFEDLQLNKPLIELLERNGITLPTNVQISGIPPILDGKNTLLTAETGSGKTLTYLLPIIQNILTLKRAFPTEEQQFNSPFALIITPGRELAAQIGEVAKLFSRNLPFTVKVIVGGRTKRRMENPSFESTDLVIASFGALSKLTTARIYKMNQIRQLVLDEADTLLDNSFNEQLCYFLRKFQFKHAPGLVKGVSPLAGVQLILASATIPTSIAKLLSEIVEIDSLVPVRTSHIHRLLPHVPQKFMRLGPSQKSEELLKIVKTDVQKKRPVIIFSNKTETSDWVSMFLNENGINCINLNKKMYYDIRMHQFRMFQNGEVDVISCTDVGSRGLDTIRAKHVINYEFPLYIADYIHRCGRTGRVGSEAGCCVTNFVVGPAEVELTQQIELAVRKNMETLHNVNANITAIIEFRDRKRKGLHFVNSPIT